MSVLKVGTASAGTGRKGWGELRVREGKKTVRLPVIAINGHAPGPHMVVLANQHGEELNGIEAIRRLAEEINPRKLRGTLFAFPTMNPRAAMQMKQCWVEENEGRGTRGHGAVDPYRNRYNMNFNWPGRKGGLLVQRVLYEVWTRAIMAPHRRADLVMDFHSQQARSAVYARDHVAAGLGVVTGIKNVIVTGGASRIACCNEVCVREGIMALTIELGGQRGFFAESIGDGCRAMRNMLKFWGMLRDRLELPPVAYILDPWRSQRPGRRCKRASCFTHYARHSGLAIPRRRQYDLARKGDVLHEIMDAHTGRIVEECRTPMGGCIYMLRAEPAVCQKGDRLFTMSAYRRVVPSEYMKAKRLDARTYRGAAVRPPAFAGKP